MTRGFWTVRHQFLLLLGIMLLTAGTVLALDATYQARHEATLNRLYDSALGGQAAVKMLTDAYSSGVIGTTVKVRGAMLTFSQGTAALDRAQHDVQQGFAVLHAESVPPRQRKVLVRIQQLRASADTTIADLRGRMQAHDFAGLDALVGARVFATLDPLLNDLSLLSDLKILNAQAQLDDDRTHARTLNFWRVGLSLGALLIIIIAGRGFLHSIYRGIDQLLRMSRGMLAGDYDVAPGISARGEIGEVVTGFLAMREEVKRKTAALGESENHAQEATRAKSAFLAAMSHEIRTPMIGITGMLELIEHTPLDGEQRRSIAIMQASANSLLQIIGDILDFSKIEAGRLELAPQDVDLRRLVAHTVGNYLGVASSKGLILETALDEDLAPAYVADALRVRQVLSNFLSNAIKFTRTGGVTVQVQRLARLDAGRDRIALRVRDSGIGISDAQRQLLFQPFSQADSGTARKFGGTGLGLAICRQLAELMGGAIELASTPGAGSTFSLILPLAPGDPAKVEALDAHAPADGFPTRPLPSVDDARREGSLVLVVDDHPTNREVLTRQLARAGFACETATDGEEGLNRWRSGQYALVLTDIHMPRMDGYQLARAIRKLERTGHHQRTPIIAITANVSKGEPEHCLAAGMDAFIGKPVRIAQMSATLRRWLPKVTFAAHAVPTARAEPPVFRHDTLLASPAAPIDPGALQEISGSDETLARNLLNDFVTSARKDLIDLRRAIAAKNFAEAVRASHRIKGAAALVGARDLHAAATEAERAGRASDEAAIATHVGSLAAALEVLAVWVEG